MGAFRVLAFVSTRLYALCALLATELRAVAMRARNLTFLVAGWALSTCGLANVRTEEGLLALFLTLAMKKLALAIFAFIRTGVPAL